MKFSSSPLWASAAILFFVAAIAILAYAVRVGLAVVGLLAIVFIILFVYAQTRK